MEMKEKIARPVVTHFFFFFLWLRSPPAVLCAETRALLRRCCSAAVRPETPGESPERSEAKRRRPSAAPEDEFKESFRGKVYIKNCDVIWLVKEIFLSPSRIEMKLDVTQTNKLDNQGLAQLFFL